MAASIDSKSKIETYLCHPRFSRTLTLPATDSHGELHVGYAVVGKDTDSFPLNAKEDTEGKRIPTIIVNSPMFSSRWLSPYYHHLAQDQGVRFVFIDRPGMADSTPVPLHQRISVWIETIPILMTAVNAKHVAFVSHSAGTMYLMNALWRMRDALSPTRPYVAFFAPWVHPEHSGVALLHTASLLPASMIGQFNKLIGFVTLNVGPKIGASSAFLSWTSSPIIRASKSLFSPSSLAAQEETEAEEERQRVEAYGFDKPERDILDKAIQKRVFGSGKSTDGLNQEALLCVKKVANGTNKVPASWGEAENYEAFIQRVAERERERRSVNEAQQSLPSNSATSPQKLHVDAFFGETDMLIGNKGGKYFRDCWTKPEYEDVFDFSGTITKGSDHDTVTECWREGMKRVCERVKWSLAEDA